jgi:hypothetical protein
MALVSFAYAQQISSAFSTLLEKARLVLESKYDHVALPPKKMRFWTASMPSEARKISWRFVMPYVHCNA